MDNSTMNPFRVAVIGAGVRGTNLARQLASSGFCTRVVAVAEPDEEKRNHFSKEFNLTSDGLFRSWEELTDKLTDCDAAIVATLDNQHAGPAIASLKKSWHLMIEKPLADTFVDCLLINKFQQETGKVVAVCHTLRFMDGYKKIKDLLEAKTIGKLIHIEHMEAIGNIRYVHNYVRNRWSKESNNTFLLLHKCCHDIDYLNWLIESPCTRVSSFGSLMYYTQENAPLGSTYRCIDCPLRNTCLYSAVKLYIECPPGQWPVKDISKLQTFDAIKEAVEKGPFGVCAWRSDNDVVDHQTVMMEFKGGTTATCTLSGYSGTNGRRVRLHGTEGEILFDEAYGYITVKRFDEPEPSIIKVPAPASYHPEDKDILNNWLSSIFHSTSVAVDTKEALRTHSVVFAAELSRKENRTVDMKEFYSKA